MIFSAASDQVAGVSLTEALNGIDCLLCVTIYKLPEEGAHANSESRKVTRNNRMGEI